MSLKPADKPSPPENKAVPKGGPVKKDVPDPIPAPTGDKTVKTDGADLSPAGEAAAQTDQAQADAEAAQERVGEAIGDLPPEKQEEVGQIIDRVGNIDQELAAVQKGLEAQGLTPE
ncbi:MAG: hypothetical protein AB1758_38095, partial [Candidatus Eremiobacterota bacterium]